MAEVPAKVYPKFIVQNNSNPKKLLAFPLLGIFIKLILLIPVIIVLYFYALAYIFFWLVIPFYILFTGKYWNAAYEFFLGFFKFNTKIALYIIGLTDKYPGFGLNDGGLFELHFDKPTSPKRWMAIPIVGFIVRLVLLIPYWIFASIVQNGAFYATVFSWFTVLFKGRYAESLYEFNNDTIRVFIAKYIYLNYLTDKYPSFWISMDHQTVKIFLIILGSSSAFSNPFPQNFPAEEQIQQDINRGINNQNLDTGNYEPSS